MMIVEHSKSANVEHRYPGVHWGAILRVEPAEGYLVIGGVRPSWLEPGRKEELSADPWEAYRAFPKDWRSEHIGRYLPHISFANAETDEQLIDFTDRYGPFVVRSLRTGLFPTGEKDRSVIIAEQDLNELRDERVLYFAALRLVFELKNTKPDPGRIVSCLREIATKTQAWPQQWRRERRLRRGAGTRPNWRFDKTDLEDLERYLLYAEQEPPTDPVALLGYYACRPDPVFAGQAVLCKLLNAFRLDVYSWGGRLVEAPDQDQSFGIRPVLYLILRRLSLSLKGGVGICANDRCRKIFDIEIDGQRFCKGDVCSRPQRQREYWSRAGKVNRQRRKQEKREAEETARKSKANF